LENKVINIAVVAEIAKALAPLKEEVIFVGGAVVSLYTDDPAADEVRPTQDVDMTLNILNLGHWVKLQEKLAILGFYPDPQGHAICSYKYKDIPVDIMSLEDGPLGPANKWYKVGFDNLWYVKAKDQEVKILSAPCFIATKFEAFANRGDDYRLSHDIEDVIYVLDNRTTIVEDIKNDNITVQNYIIQEIKKMISLGLLDEILVTHIHPLMLEERLPLVKEKIRLIIDK